MATDEVMKNYFARFIGHEMMFMVFSIDFHGIFTNVSFIVHFFRNFEVSFMVLYGFQEISETIIGVAKIPTSFEILKSRS